METRSKKAGFWAKGGSCDTIGGMAERKLFVFDMDDTLITNNKWFDLNLFLGVSEADDYRLYCEFKENQITYKEWMEQLATLYDLENKTSSRAAVTQILQEYTLRDGARTLVMLRGSKPRSSLARLRSLPTQ